MDSNEMRKFLARIVASALPLSAFAGCVCPDQTVIFPIPESEYQSVYASANSATDIPLSVCQTECARPILDADGGVTFTPSSTGVKHCELGHISGAGPAVICVVSGQCIGGRRPAGWLPAASHDNDDSPAGAWFAQLADLEAASIDAFVSLRRSLRAMNAPRELVRDASRAARDEVRHARMTAAIAARFGGTVAARRRIAREVPAMASLAVENMVEGCVRETFGAAVAAWQAECAIDPSVREAMASIARDEAAHAALAWRVHAWLSSQLDAASRASVDAARREAIEVLRHEATGDLDPSLRAIAGLPDFADAGRLLAALEDTLWRTPGLA